MKIAKNIGILNIVGVALAFLFAAMNASWGPILLVLLGLVIGFMTINSKERIWYIVTAIGISVISTAAFVSLGGSLGPIISGFFLNLIALIAPFGLIAILGQWLDMTKKK